MKRMLSVAAAVILALTGCAGAEPYKEKATVSTEATASADNSQEPIAEPQNDTTEEVTAEMEGDTITLVPLGDGDYVYEVSAGWGEAGYASYTFRTLPQVRGEQKDELTGIFDALNKLEYQPYTCDGLPEYRLTAADGTVYAINLSEKWVWRGNCEQAELSDELIAQLKGNIVIFAKPPLYSTHTPPAEYPLPTWPAPHSISGFPSDFSVQTGFLP